MDPISMISGVASLGMNVYNMIEQRKAQREQEALFERQEFANNQSADMSELASFKSSMGGTTMFALGGEDSTNISFYPGEIPISKGVKLLQGAPHEMGGINKMKLSSTGLNQDQVEAEGGELELATNQGNMMLSNRLAPSDGVHSSYAEKGLKVGLEKSKYDSKDDQFSRNATNRLSKGLKSIYDEQEMQKQSMGAEQPQQEMALGGPDWDPTAPFRKPNNMLSTGNIDASLPYEMTNTIGASPVRPYRYRPLNASFYNNDVINPINNNVTYSRKALLQPNNYPDIGTGNFGLPIRDVSGNLANPHGSAVRSPIGNTVGNFMALGDAKHSINKDKLHFSGNGQWWNKTKSYIGNMFNFNKDEQSEEQSKSQWISDLKPADYALVGLNTLSQGIAAYAHSKAKPVATPMMKAALVNPNYRNDADRSQLNRDYSKAMSDLANKGTDISRMSSTLAALSANKNAAMGKLSEDEYNKILNNHRLNSQMANQVMMQNQQVKMQNLSNAQQHKLDTISNYGKVATDTLSNIAALRNEQRRIDQTNAELDVAASDTNSNIEAHQLMNKYKPNGDIDGYKLELERLFPGDDVKINHYLEEFAKASGIEFTGSTSNDNSQMLNDFSLFNYKRTLPNRPLSKTPNFR